MKKKEKTSKFRKFIIKTLWGPLFWRWPFQKRYNVADRGAQVNFIGFLIIALAFIIPAFFFGVMNPKILLASIPWALQVLYFGFGLKGLGYFEKYPVKWHELNDLQKWYYGRGAKSGELSKEIEFTHLMQKEWLEINKKVVEKYNL